MKVSLIALFAGCAVAGTAFGVQVDPQTRINLAHVMDVPGNHPPQAVVMDVPGNHPPQAVVMDVPGNHPPQVRA